MSQEKVFYNNGGVKVTNSRVVVHGDTYSLATVTSCKSRYSTKTGLDTSNAPKRKWTTIIGIILMILYAFILIKSGSIIGAIIGVVLILLFMTIMNKIWRDREFEYKVYKVYFGSASGEQEAITSQNNDYINDIVSSVNDAIVSRG